jgi:hypothetical protein
MYIPFDSRRALRAHRSLRAGIVVMVMGALVAGCAPVYGQYGNRSGNSSYGYRVERQAYDNGYRDGYRQGRDDARDGDRFDPRGQREYRNADNGRYRSGELRRAYRSGFERGYEAGYRDARGRRYQRRR